MVEAVYFVVVATTIEEIDKFLSVHSTSGLKDVNVEEMRRTIPKLFQYLDDHDFVSCKKGMVLFWLVCCRIWLYLTMVISLHSSSTTSHSRWCLVWWLEVVVPLILSWYAHEWLEQNYDVKNSASDFSRLRQIQQLGQVTWVRGKVRQWRKDWPYVAVEWVMNASSFHRQCIEYTDTLYKCLEVFVYNW